MDEQLQEDWLDARLRDEAPYLDDAGFTARVVRQLPARRMRKSSRAWFLCGITLLASMLAYVVSGGGKFITTGVERVAGLPLLWILVLVVSCGLLFTSLAAAAAFNTSRGNRFN